jgi:rRNA maturation endonuclease Nob1
MGEVVQFPTEIKPQNIHLRLNVMADVLEEIGAHLHKSYQQVKEMENQYKHVQDQYDTLLLEYANQVGHENVEVGLLEYSTKVETDVDGDGDIVMKLTQNIIDSLGNMKEGDPIKNAEALALDSIENLMQTLTDFMETKKK